MRYDMLSPRARKNSDKPFWHRVGTAFDGDKGMTLVFDSLPLPDAEGRTVVKLFEQRDQGQQRSTSNNSSGGGFGGGDGSDIPF